jgi:radical SAM superfamily enzyme YgiQ (UPF0313 family)
MHQSGTTAKKGPPKFLLVGPYDPHGGEYTFLAPPLGVWRLAGYLAKKGVEAEVFDPNCCLGSSPHALMKTIREQTWDVIGFSTTGMTLRFDLELAYIARRLSPSSLLIAGGMEATFNPELLFQVGPFDLTVLGEGEKPLLEIAERIRGGYPIKGISGTAEHSALGGVNRFPQRALSREELKDAIFYTPYEKMPYREYWDRLELAYNVGELPHKARREAALAEIRSVRLITLNYCPMGCTFCSSTNFLNAAQGSTAAIARLNADECIEMILRIPSAVPDVRTIIFQDDIFVFTQDERILPLCEAIIAGKARGDIPKDLQFISTNRIDAMNSERLRAMRSAGFRVLGFGVENFSYKILEEFNKSRIFPYIDPVLEEAIRLGITPFLDMILTSPRCELADFAETVRRGLHWLLAGCELGMYPYVIPFSGATMAKDRTLIPHTTFTSWQIEGTSVTWEQPTKILPINPAVRGAILSIEKEFHQWLEFLQPISRHLPSRVRSLIWIICASPVLLAAGEEAPPRGEVFEYLISRLPVMNPATLKLLREFEAESPSEVQVCVGA